MDKKGFEMNFSWIFGILVGVVILSIAIYAAVNLVGTESKIAETEVAKQLGILLNPVETNLEEAGYAVINLPAETQVINRCRTHGNFGKQIIVTNERRGLGGFGEEGEEISFFNKYIFSREVEEGKNLYLIVKPFEMPYKIADLVFASASNYCFVDSPDDVSKEIGDLNPSHISFSKDAINCPQGSEKVCFGSASGCNIEVNLQGQYVTKNGESVSYEGALLYGAIFAKPEIYECQVRRLMQRNAELAYLYADKTDFLSGKGCSSNLKLELLSFASELQFGKEDNSVTKLNNIYNTARNLEERNDLLECELF